MAQFRPQFKPVDRLGPSGRPGTAMRVLKIIVLLALTGQAIAVTAWIVGNLLYRQDYGQKREVPRQAVEAPPRPAGAE